MRLIDHISWIEALGIAQLGFDKLVKDQKELVWVDRSRVEIVVAIFGIVEMKAAELSSCVQARHDLLDIHVRGMMAQIDKALAADMG